MYKKIIFIISVIVIIIVLFLKNNYKSYYKEKESNVYYYKDSTGTEVPVPVGFVVSKNNNIVDTGLVIIDNTNTETNGNEFVWVPCDNFERIFYNIQKLSITNYNMNFIDEKEYKDIKESVKKYKGFYVGRFEASKSDFYINNVQIAASVRNKFPWTEIPYSTNMNDIYGYSFGALKVSKYTYKNNNNVNSTIMYPEHYDSIIKWLLSFDNLKSDANIKINEKDILENSRQIGSYSKPLRPTGESNVYCIKNICDLAGNAQELTTESYLGNYHIARGGNSKRNNSFVSRVNIDAYTTAYKIGFRLVLII